MKIQILLIYSRRLGPRRLAGQGNEDGSSVYINADLEVVYPPQIVGGGGGGLLLAGDESPSSELLLAREEEEDGCSSTYVPSPAPELQQQQQQQQQQQRRPPPPPYDRQQVLYLLPIKIEKNMAFYVLIFCFAGCDDGQEATAAAATAATSAARRRLGRWEGILHLKTDNNSSNSASHVRNEKRN